MTQFQESVADAVDHVIPAVELIGAAVVVLGVAVAAVIFVLSETRLRPIPYEHVRLVLGRFLALGIEFQLAADILKTAVSPTFEDLGQLGAIVAIRTVLNYFLAKEIERAEEMEKEGMLMGPADMPEPETRRSHA
jgi:uncharacterized membrane protein